MNGLTPIRTVRLIGAMIAIIGMIFVLVSRVLTAVLAIATDAIHLALARYSNFTGRIASRNFAEDKQLLAMVKDVNALLPTAETALTVLLVVGILVLLVALVCLAFPKQAVHVFVALRLLKWDMVEPMEGLLEDEEAASATPLSRRTKITIAGSAAGVVLLVVLIAVFSGFSERQQVANVESALKDMQDWAAGYVDAQKTFFARNNDIGGPKSLQLPDTAETDYFKYKVTGSRFVAENKVPLGGCAAGNKWTVSSSTKGFFTKELVLYRSLPKDTVCAKLTPEFKNIGRHKKNAPAPEKP
ncbi:MAG: hypothetical protein J6U20_07715 [Fibrobacter sp.]|nr:hypothetical protein [Fibrobacter sp.]